MARALVDLERAVALARAGKTLREIGAALGVSRQAVAQRLKQAGVAVAEARDVRCDYCGARLRSAHEGAGPHVCAAKACRHRYRNDAAKAARAKAPPPVRAVCAGCGKPMARAKPRADGAPSFCASPGCKAARLRWHYQHDPAHRAAVRAYQRAYDRRRRAGSPAEAGG
jgi:hypothetical protein